MNSNDYSIISRQIDDLKSKGKHREAGRMAALNGRDSSYGCHFGMRSDRFAAMAEFAEGYAAAAKDARLDALDNLTLAFMAMRPDLPASSNLAHWLDLNARELTAKERAAARAIFDLFDCGIVA